MSNVKYLDPIAHISGKICRHSEVIFAHRKASGKNYTTKICNPRTSAPSALESQMRNKFSQATAATLLAMQDAQQLRAYTTAFKAQKKYTTLRGYIFAQEYAKL